MGTKHVHTKIKTMTDAPTKQKLWGGRFTGKTDPLYVNRRSTSVSTPVLNHIACMPSISH